MGGAHLQEQLHFRGQNTQRSECQLRRRDRPQRRLRLCGGDVRSKCDGYRNTVGVHWGTRRSVFEAEIFAARYVLHRNNAGGTF